MLQGWIAQEENGGQKLQAYWRNGAFAEKILCPVENVHGIPEELLEQYGAGKLAWLTCTLVPYGGLLAGGLEAGQCVMIQPATGHFGTAAVAVAIAMGASSVFAVGRNKSVLDELVKKFGARVKPVVVTGTESDKEVYASLEVDMSLNLYPPGSRTDAIVHGLSALKSGGTLVLMGGVLEPIPIPYMEVMLKSITIKGQFMYPRSAVAKMIGLVEAGLLDLNAFDEKMFKLMMYSKPWSLRLPRETGGGYIKLFWNLELLALEIS
jgi:alcohol dehydrogenase